MIRKTYSCLSILHHFHKEVGDCDLIVKTKGLFYGIKTKSSFSATKIPLKIARHFIYDLLFWPTKCYIKGTGKDEIGSRRTLYFLLFLFSYALILFNFENRRFSFVFPSVGKNFQFSLKTEGFLNHKSYGKASVFF